MINPKRVFGCYKIEGKIKYEDAVCITSVGFHFLPKPRFFRDTAFYLIVGLYGRTKGPLPLSGRTQSGAPEEPNVTMPGFTLLTPNFSGIHTLKSYPTNPTKLRIITQSESTNHS